ncbi:MAG: undecaprenyl-diphosphate phosphatase, partial [Hoeflea sp.]
AYDLYKNYDKLGSDDVTAIVVGFIMAFIAGVIVVRSLLDFVSRHGFALFAWWRIVVGTLGLIGLWAL